MLIQNLPSVALVLFSCAITIANLVPELVKVPGDDALVHAAAAEDTYIVDTDVG